MSQLFAWVGQSTGVSALVSFLPKNTQGWSPLEWTGLISLQSKGLSRVFSNTTVQKHQFFSTQLSSWEMLGWMKHKLESRLLGETSITSCEELTHWKRVWCWEGLRAGGEGDDRGWDSWMASPTRWTWGWMNSGSWWWTRRPGVLRFMRSQRVGHDWVTELNWTESVSPFLPVFSLFLLRTFSSCFAIGSSSVLLWLAGTN